MDQRRAARREIKRAVHIATGAASIACELQDISATGAQVAIPHPMIAPQEFLLVLDDRLERWCRVMWRGETSIGVTFIDAPDSVRNAALF